MIPAPPGIWAEFQSPGNDAPRIEVRRVMAFEDDGQPLVVGERGLVTVNRYATERGLKFNRVRDEVSHGDDHDYVALIPGGGWHLKWNADNGGETEPVVAWALLRSAFAAGNRLRPLTSSGQALFDTDDPDEYQLLPPDA
jgi:hypothetical protein